MDGMARIPEGLLGVERSFEGSRLSSQFVSLAYERVVAIVRRESSPWNKDDHERSRYESIGTNRERRWAAGG